MTKKTEKIVLTINGEKYKPKFGLKFLKDIGILPNNLESNMETYFHLVAGLVEGDPLFVLEVVKSSLAHTDLTEDEIEHWFEESEEVEGLSDRFLLSLESSALLSKQVKQMKEKYTKAMNQALESQNQV